jgi:hypothetical protein
VLPVVSPSFINDDPGAPLMRTTHQTLGSLAALTTTALIGLGSAVPASAMTADAVPTSGTTTTIERGNVIECTGTLDGRPVHASLYENSRYTNVIQVLVGDDGDQVGNSREVAEGFLDHRAVRGSLRVGGKKAVVRGTAARIGKRIAVHDAFDDAGQHITVDGFHRRLATDLELRWGRRTTALTCDNAFFYRLQVTKEDVTGD